MDLEGWDCHSLNHNSKSKNTPILVVKAGPKNVAEIKQAIKKFDSCVMLASNLKKLFISTLNKMHVTSLDSDAEYDRIAKIFEANSVSIAKNNIEFIVNLENAIDAIPSTTDDFENRGLFSTHYLRNRIFDDAPNDLDMVKLHNSCADLKSLLQALGWTIVNERVKSEKGKVVIVITDQENFSIREKADSVAPSYAAISELSKYKWVILTNGSKWRLYTNRISASSTNYFEINLVRPSNTMLRYLGIIFGYGAFTGDNPKIDLYFDQGKEFAAQLEENLALRIMSQDGVLLNITKGILDHDMKTKFGKEELASAKDNALRIIYRVWFVAYAESRNLLPVSDPKYKDISLRRLRDELDKHSDTDSDEPSCWQYLLNLFEGIRNGKPQNNLPQYNGDLFRHTTDIDDISISNKWLVPALSDLLLRDGDAIDYASLSVRHLGSILESVMEFSVQQAKENVMLLVKNNKIIQVRTVKESNYSYKRNDLYLVSKGGLATRKSTASYYTPDEMVKFLVEKGLKPILEERTIQIAKDMQAYKKNLDSKTKKTCMDRLLDIQVLDPTMGSGHFLVEALNRLTAWATEILKKHPLHPLLEELETDRKIILAEQREKNITIDENLLTHDILLKRKIMKRCIFGVDLNPMAVEIAKLALWLDSFAIGVPLTYMDHHIRIGDSTIGMFLNDIEDMQNQSLDDWTPGQDMDRMLEDVSASPDVTVSQVRQSEERYRKYAESISPTRRMLDALTASMIDDDILPKKGDAAAFIRRFAKYAKNEDKILTSARKKISDIDKRRNFFHWELEMRDAFTDTRSGFDVIVGNPPWDRIEPNDNELFTPYYPAFKSLSTKTKKKEIIDILLQNNEIKSVYDAYKKSFSEKTNFYTTANAYQIQGIGYRELSKLILERAFQLLAKNGTISMVLPSQILSSTGSVDIRKEILFNKDIQQLYVFENKKKIFDIDSRYRFMLLTLKGSKTKRNRNEFPVGFYLHHLSSLVDPIREKEKFGTHSKAKIQKMFPETLIIPESSGVVMDILIKMYKHPKLTDALSKDGMSISFSSGFQRTNDSDLFQEDGKGWPIHEGKTIHQYNHTWSKPAFTAQSRAGLERENKPKYAGKHRVFYNSYRLVFRDVSSPTNMRTVITTVIPPKTFHTHSLASILLSRNTDLILGTSYLLNVLYLCGVMNSTSFDFIVRQIIQMHVITIIKTIPIPLLKYKQEITNLTTKLIVGGHSDFAELAEKIRIPNIQLTITERIETTARLDVIVAKAYGLDKQEYKTILESFKSFKENPDLCNQKEIVWDNSNLKEFYGEMRKKALEIFDDVK